MRSRGWTGLLPVAATALLVSVAGACGDDDPQLAGAARNPPLNVATVTLPDAASGDAVPMTAPPGELLLVYFGYTSCPDVCPTTMSDISRALDDLGADLAGKVTAAMVTVDPERDTDEVLTILFEERS